MRSKGTRVSINEVQKAWYAFQHGIFIKAKLLINKYKFDLKTSRLISLFRVLERQFNLYKKIFKIIMFMFRFVQTDDKPEKL